jgi:DUF3040 family protein
VIKGEKGDPRDMNDAWEPTMFTPYERRQLRLIEQWFELDDPQLASTLRTGPVRRPSAVPQVTTIAVACVLATLGIATGAFILVFSAVLTGLAGFFLVTRRRDKLR